MLSARRGVCDTLDADGHGMIQTAGNQLAYFAGVWRYFPSISCGCMHCYVLPRAHLRLLDMSHEADVRHEQQPHDRANRLTTSVVPRHR